MVFMPVSAPPSRSRSPENEVSMNYVSEETNEQTFQQDYPSESESSENENDATMMENCVMKPPTMNSVTAVYPMNYNWCPNGYVEYNQVMPIVYTQLNMTSAGVHEPTFVASPQMFVQNFI
jgi:hypothetical protein